MKRQVAELQARASRRRDGTEVPLPAAGVSQPEEHCSTSAAAGTDPTRVPVEVLSSPHCDSQVDGRLADDPVQPPAGIVSKKLAESIGSLGTLTTSQQEKLLSFLQDHHAAFALEEHERGETDLLEMDIDTGDAEPWNCSPRHMPFAVWDEVARQLHRSHAGCRSHPAINQPMVQPSHHGTEKGWHAPILHQLPPAECSDES